MLLLIFFELFHSTILSSGLSLSNPKEAFLMIEKRLCISVLFTCSLLDMIYIQESQILCAVLSRAARDTGNLLRAFENLGVIVSIK